MLLKHSIPTVFNPLHKYPEDFNVVFADHTSLSGPDGNGLYRLDFGRIAFERGVPDIEGRLISEVKEQVGIMIGPYTLQFLAITINNYLEKQREGMRRELAPETSKKEEKTDPTPKCPKRR